MYRLTGTEKKATAVVECDDDDGSEGGRVSTAKLMDVEFAQKVDSSTNRKLINRTSQLVFNEQTVYPSIE
jgi:hypothetical protein